MSDEDDKTLPVFLQKLVALMEDVQSKPFIDWGTSGDTILVKDPVEFSKRVSCGHRVGAGGRRIRGVFRVQHSPLMRGCVVSC